MAQEIDEIFDEIIAEKESKSTLTTLLPLGTNFQALLDDVTTGSKVGKWRLWVWLHSVLSWKLQVLFDTFKAEVEVIKAQAIFGTEPWWIDRIFEFQYGYSVEVLEIDGVFVPGYANIDESAQIVAAAAISADEFGASRIKVAKDDNGDLVAFDQLEIDAINAYRDDIQPAGATIQVISLNADLAIVTANIIYNAQFDLAQITIDVEAAINNYFKNLDFGGKVLLNSLIDELQAIESVVDIEIFGLQCKVQGGTYVTVTREYIAGAGYVKVDPGSPLSGTLTFTPQV